MKPLSPCRGLHGNRQSFLPQPNSEDAYLYVEWDGASSPLPKFPNGFSQGLKPALLTKPHNHQHAKKLSETNVNCHDALRQALNLLHEFVGTPADLQTEQPRPVWVTSIHGNSFFHSGQCFQICLFHSWGIFWLSRNWNQWPFFIRPYPQYQKNLDWHLLIQLFLLRQESTQAAPLSCGIAMAQIDEMNTTDLQLLSYESFWVLNINATKY